jgi:glyoxalase family protein
MIKGLHHITIGCNDAQRTIDFYTGVLGFRFVKRTVNFDDPAATICISETSGEHRARR